jgi:molybdopterin synthase sulfur carrier subunit
MAVDVHVAAMFRSMSGGKGNLTVEGKSIRELAEAIDREYPGFAERVLQPDGSIQSGVLVSLNGNLVQSNPGDTKVQSGDKVYFLSAFAGG